MAELILTNYQAQVFRDVETLLKTTGNPRGVKVNPKAYYLSKKIAVYIINNISKNQSTTNGGTTLDVENVYQWLFGILPTPPSTPVSNTGTSPPPPPPPAVTNTIGLGLGNTNLSIASQDTTPTSITQIGYPNLLADAPVIDILSGHSNISFMNMGFGSSLYFKIITADESEYIGDVVQIEYNLTSGGGANLTAVRTISQV